MTIEMKGKEKREKEKTTNRIYLGKTLQFSKVQGWHSAHALCSVEPEQTAECASSLCRKQSKRSACCRL
jgi:hypothetical protein